MEKLLLKRWVQLVLGALVAFVAGVIVEQQISAPSPEYLDRLDRVELHGGSLTAAALVPLTAVDAHTEGWTELSSGCLGGHGRVFRKGEEAYVLVYDLDGALIGLYLFSLTEMPSPPWRFTQGSDSVYPNLEFDHWGMSMYFKDRSSPCVTKVEG